MYYELIKELSLSLRVVKKDFKDGLYTPFNHNEALLLYCISEEDHSAYSLAKSLGQDPALMHRNLKKLQEEGYLLKTRLGKRAALSLSPLGQELLDTLNQAIDNFGAIHPELYSEGDELLNRLKEFREKVEPILFP